MGEVIFILMSMWPLVSYYEENCRHFFFPQRIFLLIVTKESNSVKICKEQHCHLENGQN